MRRVCIPSNENAKFERRNGQCGCVSQNAVYPLAVEEMLLGFEHSYDTSLLGQGFSARAARIYNQLSGED